jgi:hypothetical protein
MKRRVIDLRVGDRFIWRDPLGSEDIVLTVRSGPVNHFGSVTVEVQEWDFDFEATSSVTVSLVSPRPD